MKLRMVLAIALGLVFAGGALAEDKGLDNHAKRDPYYEKLKGKKVLFVPLAMGFETGPLLREAQGQEGSVCPPGDGL